MDVFLIKAIKVVFSVAGILPCVVYNLTPCRITRILKYELDGVDDETNISVEYTYRR